MIKNLKVNPTTAVAWGTYTVTHNLGLGLKDLIIDFYLVTTTANSRNFTLGTILRFNISDYNGNTAGEGYGASIRLANGGWTLTVDQTGNAQGLLLFSKADLYCNVVGLTNIKISTMTGSVFSLG
jgi:hypothetical protein